VATSIIRATAQFSSRYKRSVLRTGCDLGEKNFVNIELYIKRAKGLGITYYVKHPLSYWLCQRCHSHLAA
jgi:hypothetical protein